MLKNPKNEDSEESEPVYKIKLTKYQPSQAFHLLLPKPAAHFSSQVEPCIYLKGTPCDVTNQCPISRVGSHLCTKEIKFS